MFKRLFHIIVGSSLLLLLGFLIMKVAKNLRQPYFWYDEAVQFWVSKGLTPDSPPFSTPGGLLDVFQSNRYYNLDPGGFGFLLFLWSSISNHFLWLRVLPFIFFLVSVAACAMLGWQLSKQRVWAIMAALIPFFVPNWITLSVELRAYSMEALGTVLCAVGLMHLSEGISVKRLLSWSLVFCFFISSRYSEIIIVFVSSLYVLFLIYKHTTTFAQFIRLAMVYATPLFLMVALIYIGVMRIQNADANTLVYLPYLSKALSQLWDAKHLVFQSFFLLSLLALLSLRWLPVLRPLAPVLFLACVSHLFFIVLSIAGWHPWSSVNSRCLSMQLLVIMSFSLLLMMVLQHSAKNYPNIALLLAICYSLFFIGSNYETLDARYKKRNNVYYSLQSPKLPRSPRIYVDYYGAPYVKYLYEYGDGKTSNPIQYPSAFTLATCVRHGFTKGNESPYFSFLKTQPCMNDLMDYDVLITPILIRKKNNDAWVLLPGAKSVWVKKDE